MKTLKLQNIYRLFCFSLIAIWCSTPVQGAKEISHYGITWSFAADHTTGFFANGEPWVVGPVTIVSIDNPSVPANSYPRGGAMVNPIPNRPQGYCPKYSASTERSRYDEALDVSLVFPFDLKVEDVIVTAKALNTGEAGGNNHVDTIAALTVLANEPEPGSFRPSPYGDDRRIRFNQKNIDWSILKNLSQVKGTPTHDEIKKFVPSLPWFEWDDQWVGSSVCPMTNVASGDGGNFRSNYGREIAIKWGIVALWLNSNVSQTDKKDVMIQTIQCGLDIASYIKNGGGYPSSGGHKIGRKFPLFLAAMALKDPELLALASNPALFAEDQSTFFVRPEDVGRAVEHSPEATYLETDVGIPEWGMRHLHRPFEDDRRWRDGHPYRFSNWPAMSAQVLAAELMNGKEVWGHPAIFAYNERFVANEPLVNSFEGNFWATHKAGLPSAIQGLRIKR